MDNPKHILQELAQASVQALSDPGDVSDEASVREMVEAVVGAFGRVDTLPIDDVLEEKGSPFGVSRLPLEVEVYHQ